MDVKGLIGEIRGENAWKEIESKGLIIKILKEKLRDLCGNREGKENDALDMSSHASQIDWGMMPREEPDEGYEEEGT